ncbi:hypothetical protein KC356_g302 [Hortaea werneckii]|nr:hypothetical protein KC356_g302 [Hortaea werneckii]
MGEDHGMLTYPHHDQETRHEAPQLDDAVGPAVHKVILVLGLAADPVRDGRDDVGGDDQEGEVVFEQGGGEDDEEEAYGEDLLGGWGLSGLPWFGLMARWRNRPREAAVGVCSNRVVVEYYYLLAALTSALAASVGGWLTD